MKRLSLPLLLILLGIATGAMRLQVTPAQAQTDEKAGEAYTIQSSDNLWRLAEK